MKIQWKRLAVRAWDLLVRWIRATAPDKTQADPEPTAEEAFDRWKGSAAALLLALCLTVPAGLEAQASPTRLQVDSLRRDIARLDSALVAVRRLFARLDSLTTPAPDTVVTPDTIVVPPPPDTIVAPPPPPPPPPPPVSTLPAWAQSVDRILRPIPNCAKLAVSTGPERQWYDMWRTWEPVRWKADSSRWDAANYYDRAATYLAMAVCEIPHDSTLSALYLKRGLELAVDYRDKYLIPAEPKGGTSPHWAQLEGVAVHALVTGDPISRRWVGRAADGLATTAYYTKRVFGDTLHVDYENRIGQRAILAVLLAHELQSPGKNFPATRWPGVLDTLLTLTTRAQRANGSWGFRCSTGACGLTFPYMDMLLSDALIRFERLYRHDARILPIVQRTVDFHLANALRADSTFHYNLTPLPGGTIGGRSASGDLNGLHPATYAWLTQQTGDSTYLARVRPIFAKGVKAGQYSYSKQFNQAFWNSYRYVAMRQAATASPTP